MFQLLKFQWNVFPREGLTVNIVSDNSLVSAGNKHHEFPTWKCQKFEPGRILFNEKDLIYNK